MALVLLAAVPQTAAAAGSGSFQRVGGALPEWLQAGARAAPLPGNRALVAGGFTGAGRLGGTASSEIEILNAAGEIVTRATMTHSRSGAAVAPLSDGRVLIAGGFEGSSGYVGPGAPVASSEIYDPRTHSLSAGPSLQAPREDALAVSLPDGSVLVIGGYNHGPLASAEVLKPGSDAFSPAGSLNAARDSAAGALAPDGRVLVLGGIDEIYRLRGDTEFFNPATGTSATGPQPLSYPFPTPGVVAAPLPDGRILFMGGSQASAKGADVYDPRLGAFTTKGIGQLNEPRTDPAVARLSDGRVLVAGGRGSSDQTVEIYAATNRFKAKLVKHRLVVKVKASGRVKVRGIWTERSTRVGGPGRLRLPLRLSKRGKRRLRSGRSAMKVRITFSPQGGLPRSRIKRVRFSD